MVKHEQIGGVDNLEKSITKTRRALASKSIEGEKKIKERRNLTREFISLLTDKYKKAAEKKDVWNHLRYVNPKHLTEIDLDIFYKVFKKSITMEEFNEYSKIFKFDREKNPDDKKYISRMDLKSYLCNRMVFKGEKIIFFKLD